MIHGTRTTDLTGKLGLVIGAGGGSLTLTDPQSAKSGRQAANPDARLGGQPLGRKSKGLAMEVLKKPGVEKIAVMMSIVSNHRGHRRPRRSDQALLEPAQGPRTSITCLPDTGSWEEEGAAPSTTYGITSQGTARVRCGTRPAEAVPEGPG